MARVREHRFIVAFIALILGLLVHTAQAAQCSATNLCETGCCSKYDFCGFTEDHCGAGCLSTCDAKKKDAPAGGGGECSADVPCKVGCCSKYGNCGFGEEYCSKAKGCVNNCERKSDCDPGWGLQWAKSKNCPLNVCCSDYGFCGMTDKFCGEKDKINQPSCSVDSHKINRVIGYWEQWTGNRGCNSFWPEEIPYDYYTHINFAFASIDPETFKISMSADGDDLLWKRIQALRLMQPGVEIWVAIGGWLFNDPDQPTKTTFSDIARSEKNQKAFAKSLLAMMSKYGFDGVDIDWEYPVADERSGRGEDFENFPQWMKNLRSQLHSSGKKYGLSLTLPASYWYLQHFNIKKLQEPVDWFNIMSYDMHGTWDQNNTWVGPFLNPHTNLTEIKNSMDLLWRNDIDPEKVVMGMAFYGRSYILESADCGEPGCTYRSGGNAGPCSATIGVLLNSEIQSIVKKLNLTATLHKEDAVNKRNLGLWAFDTFNMYNVEAMLQPSCEVEHLYSRRGPPSVFGRNYELLVMEDFLEMMDRIIDPFPFVSDMMANPQTGNEAMDALYCISEELCELPDDEDEESGEEDSASINKKRDLLWDRHINQLAGESASVAGQPSMDTILQGILEGDLILHYARWEYFNDEADPMLELTYWIGPTLTGLGANQANFQNTPEDRWVVFHVSYVNGDTSAPNSHSHALNYRDGQQWRVGRRTIPQGYERAILRQRWALDLRTRGYFDQEAMGMVYPYKLDGRFNPGNYGRFSSAMGKKLSDARKLR